MQEVFEKLFEPIKISTLELKNRYVMNAVNTRFGNAEFVSQRVIHFFMQRAMGGVGLIVAGGFKVDEIAADSGLLGIYDDKYLPGLRDLASGVHAGGAKVFAQLFHAGRYARLLNSGQQSVSASAVKSPLTGQVPRALSVAEIKGVVNNYSQAAARAKAAGFDGIEVLSSTGYLISQFLSPVTNKRRDAYGGSLSNRMRFGLEIGEAIRKEVGYTFPLTFRISGNDFMGGTDTNREACIFAKELEQIGVDAINVQSGWHEAKVPTTQQITPPGAFVYLARGIRNRVSCPVITSNKLGNPYLAERILSCGHADLIGLARPLIADPYLPQKVRDGRINEVIRCVSCGQGCFDMVFAKAPITCLVNPFVGKENQWQIKPVKIRKKVLVVGGGPAGMQAAKIANLRGHHVFLYEESEKLGGQLKLVANSPIKRDFGMLIDDLCTSIQKNGVEVKTCTRVTREIVEELDPSVLIVATGAEPILPNIVGIDGKNVFRAWDVLAGKVNVGKKVIVVGGNATGLETALYLASQGTLSPEVLHFLMTNRAETPKRLGELLNMGDKEVTVIEMKTKVGEDIGRSNRWTVMLQLKRLGVTIMTGTKAVGITPNGLEIETEDRPSFLPADSILIAVGSRSNKRLMSAAENLVPEMHIVGDAKEPRRALDAIHDATHVGLNI